MSSPQPDSLRKRSVVGGLWTVLQSAYTNLASTVAFILLARLVSPSAFGLVSLAAVFVAIATLLSDLGVTPALTRAPTVTDASLSTGFWLGLAVSLGLCGILQLLASPFAAWLHEPPLSPIIRVVSLTLPVTSLCAVPTAILSRELRMRPQAMRQVLSVSVATLGAIVMAFAGLGVWALVFQDCGTVALDAYVLWRAVTWRPRLTFVMSEARTLLGFGYKVTLTQLVHQGRDRGAELLIGRLLGAHVLGFWVVATRISQLAVSMFASAINAIALPAFALVQSDASRLHRAVRHAVRICGTAALPGLLAIAALSPVLIPFLFGQKWQITGNIAQITAVTSGLAAFQWLDGNIWWAIGKPNVEFRLVTGISIAHLAVVWFLAPYGLTAVALGLLARTLVSVPIRLAALVKVGGIPLWCYRDLPMIALLSALMYGVMMLAGAALKGDPPVVVIVAELILAAVCYSGLSWLLQRENVLEFRRDLMHAVGKA